jgi:hypothetical protein
LLLTLQRLIANARPRATYARRAAERARFFSIDRAADRYIRLYEEVAA